MKPVLALVFALRIDAGPADTKPIIQVLPDTRVQVQGTDGACMASAPLEGGERRVGCIIGKKMAGVSLTCKAGDVKSTTFFIVSGEGDVFRIELSCGSKEVTQ